MDLLFKRYASPFSFMDEMIHAGRLTEFVENIIKTINQEIEDENKEKEMQFHWELWLHRVFDKSFKEYLGEIENNQKHQNLSERTIETTIQHSMNLLHNFNPEKGGE